MTYEVVKQNKRLWIRCVETGTLIYTPPDFMKLVSREPLKDLARKITFRDINAITAFETTYR